MSKFLHNATIGKDDPKARAIVQVFSENRRARNASSQYSLLFPLLHTRDTFLSL